MSAEIPKHSPERIAEELLRLSDAIKRTADRVIPGDLPAAMTVKDATASPYLAKAETIYLQRRRRVECFPGAGELFQDPAWDILLHLFVAYERGEMQSMGSVAIASGVVAKVGQRWVAALTHAGLVRCTPNPRQSSLVCVEITPAAVEMMYCFLDGLDAAQS